MRLTCLLLSLALLLFCSSSWADGSGTRHDVNDPCVAQLGKDSTHRWWDTTHQQFSNFLCWPGRWVDHFFAKPGTNDWAKAGTTLDISQGATFRDDHQRDYPLNTKVRIELPNASRYFSLLFVNDDAVQQDNRRVTATQSGQQTKRSTHGFRSALRWAISTSKHMNIDMDVGVRSGIHPYTRLRYRERQPVTRFSWTQFTQQVYMRDPEGFSSDSKIDYTYNLSAISSLRFTVDGFFSEVNRKAGTGWVISQNASYFYRLNDRSAIQYQLGTYAYTEPTWQTQSYRAAIRYRRNIFRPWLFYEVEPFWEWPRNQHFGTVTGITLRLEMVFGYYKK